MRDLFTDLSLRAGTKSLIGTTTRCRSADTPVLCSRRSQELEIVTPAHRGPIVGACRGNLVFQVERGLLPIRIRDPQLELVVWGNVELGPVSSTTLCNAYPALQSDS